MTPPCPCPHVSRIFGRRSASGDSSAPDFHKYQADESPVEQRRQPTKTVNRRALMEPGPREPGLHHQNFFG